MAAVPLDILEDPTAEAKDRLAASKFWLTHARGGTWRPRTNQKIELTEKPRDEATMLAELSQITKRRPELAARIKAALGQGDEEE